MTTDGQDLRPGGYQRWQDSAQRWGLGGRAASLCCLNSKVMAGEVFTENECGIKAQPHIFKSVGIDPMLAFCGDGSAR